MKLVFRQHAIRRMFERRISVEDVNAALVNGKIIEDYPDDAPYPSRLLLGYAARGRYTSWRRTTQLKANNLLSPCTNPIRRSGTQPLL